MILKLENKNARILKRIQSEHKCFIPHNLKDLKINIDADMNILINRAYLLLGRLGSIAIRLKFGKLIATIGSREVSASIVLQAQSQLKAIYKDNADTIIGNCDSILFLCGKEKLQLRNCLRL